MSRSTTGPHGIDLTAPGGVEKLLAFHRGLCGHARMEAEQPQLPAGQPADAPQRPDGVSEDEWSALGDPGKRALVRERDRATRAEHDLAAARSASAPKPAPPKQDPPGGQGEQQQGDIAAIVQQAVAAAIAPFQQAQQQREAEDAARQVAQAVTTEADTRLYDPSDALSNLNLAELTDGSGRPDPTKITAALDDLVKRKPHLAKVVDTRPHPGAGSFLGGGAAPAVSMDDQVKAALAKMQASTGVKLAGS